MKTILVSAMSIILFSCAMAPRRGVIAKKMSNNEAHVTLGREEVATGDRVTLFKSVCEMIGGRKGEAYYCYKTKVGTGRISELLGASFSTVILDGSATFDEGTFVEKD